MVERLGVEALPEIKDYLAANYRQCILLLDDLSQIDDPSTDDRDELTLIGYRAHGEIVAAQGFYQFGRWLPHYRDPAILDSLLEDMRRYSVRWMMGAREILDPIWEDLRRDGHRLTYDEVGYLYAVDRPALRFQEVHGVRRATLQDAGAIAKLRFDFDVEYFGTPPQRISKPWCLRLARRYIARGTYLAERQGRIVSMVATEADIPQVTQIGAVYTSLPYRRCGLAKGVVSALCAEKLRDRERVALVVRRDNQPALSVYQALGFQHWDDYRMTRLK